MIPRLTILTVVRNDLDGLKATAASVLAQTWTDYEWIVVDGASSDGTAEHVRDVLAPRLSFWCSEPDGGVYDAMNKGLAHAAGAYVLALNAGDVLHAADTLAQVFAAAPETDVIYGDWCHVQRVGRLICRPPRELPRDFFNFSNLCHQAMFVRTELLRARGYDTSWRLFADWARWRELAHEGRTFGHVAVIVCDYDLRRGLSAGNSPVRRREYRRLDLEEGALPPARCRFEFAFDGWPAWLWSRLQLLMGPGWRKLWRKIFRAAPSAAETAPRNARGRLLYVGHRHHLTTRSVEFLLDLLRRDYDVTCCAVDPARLDDLGDLDALAVRDFDVCVVFQLMPSVAEIRRRVTFRRGVFFPMFDCYRLAFDLSHRVWLSYADFKIVSFSRTVHEEVRAAGFDSEWIQYFPEPCSEVADGDAASVFFWERCSAVTLGTVAHVLGGGTVRHVHVHRVPDPGQDCRPASADTEAAAAFLRTVDVGESRWFETRAAMLDEVAKSALYMAPRACEGIGMSFLEAMAMGRCVVAPDVPTMNEYIRDGENGLLYPFDLETMRAGGAALALDEDRVRRIQRAARASVAEGHARWLRDRERILDWMLDDVRARRMRIFLFVLSRLLARKIRARFAGRSA